MKLQRFEVLSAHGNVLGYVYGRDIDHAWSQAAQRYRVPFTLIGPGALPSADLARGLHNPMYETEN